MRPINKNEEQLVRKAYKRYSLKRQTIVEEFSDSPLIGERKQQFLSEVGSAFDQFNKELKEHNITKDQSEWVYIEEDTNNGRTSPTTTH